MSKNKGSKNVKKAPAETGKKTVSDYQTGKKSDFKDEGVLKKRNERTNIRIRGPDLRLRPAELRTGVRFRNLRTLGNFAGFG